MSQNYKWKSLILNQKLKNPLGYAHWILIQVSRTFALNITILSPKVKTTVLIAYLFCRMADTLEDDDKLKNKKDLLYSFSKLFSSTTFTFQEFQKNLPSQWKDSKNYDQFLTYHGHFIFDLLKKESPKNKKSIKEWIQEMIKGMILFLPPTISNKNQTSWMIKNLRELDVYCYFVAGVIGKMLTEIFYNNSPYISKYLKQKLDIYSNSFGLGLQITNILKDIQSDLNRNVCFLPLSLILEQNLEPQNFLNFPNHHHTRPIMKELLSKTQMHLHEALSYSLLIPRMEFKLRLFCLWPLFIAIASLSKISQTNLTMDIKTPIKISRKEVKTIMFKITLFCYSNILLKKYFKYYNQQINNQLYS